MANRGSSTLSILSGMAVGALAMYALDPVAGGRRRALARDKMIRAARLAGREGRKQLSNFVNHVKGGVAEQMSAMRDRQRQLDDDLLLRRVRAQIGHVVAHPGALDVRVEDGMVIVSGPVLAGEEDNLHKRLEETRGVRTFDCRLEVHDSSKNVPALQGESRWQRKRRVG